jgi:hypothetical protein
MLTLYMGDCENLFEAATADDDYACRLEGNANSIFHSTLAFPTLQYTWYHVRVSALQGQSGVVTVSVSHSNTVYNENNAPVENPTRAPIPTPAPSKASKVSSSSNSKKSKSTKASSKKVAIVNKVKRTKSIGDADRSGKKKLVTKQAARIGHF